MAHSCDDAGPFLALAEVQPGFMLTAGLVAVANQLQSHSRTPDLFKARSPSFLRFGLLGSHLVLLTSFLNGEHFKQGMKGERKDRNTSKCNI